MRALAALALLALTASAVAQDAAAEAEQLSESNEGFFGWGIVIFLVAFLALMAVLEIRRKKGQPSKLPAFTDETFEEEVLGARTPVLVHFARHWNVANAAAVAQTELLAWQNRGAVLVGTLEIDENPGVMEKLPGLEPPAYLLFYQGRKLFHRPGLRQAQEIQDDIDRALSHEGF